MSEWPISSRYLVYQVLVAVLLAIAGGLVAGIPALSEVNCFGSAHVPPEGIRVYRNAPPPASDNEEGYRFWPVTDAVTMQIDQIARSRAHSVNAYAFLWANRCHRIEGMASDCSRVRKGNVLQPRYRRDGAEVRPYFSTFMRANTCTLIQTGNLLGEDRSALESKARAVGISLAGRSEDLAAHIVNDRFVDLCIIADRPLPARTRGIVLDYEVADGRSAEMTLSFLTEFASLVQAHGKEAILYNTPLDAPSQRWTSISKSNASKLHQIFDKNVIFLWHGNKQGSIEASFNAQLDVLRGEDGNQPIDMSKLILVFELANTNTADTRMVGSLMESTGIKNLMFWRHRAHVGGSCERDVNRKISCLVFRSCS